MTDDDQQVREEAEAIVSEFIAGVRARQQDRALARSADLLEDMGKRASGPQADDVRDVPDGSTEPPSREPDSAE